MTSPVPVPAGWYAGGVAGQERWWDGSAWGTQTRPAAHALAPSAAVLAPPGWYPDGVPGQLRYFDGRAWTDQVRLGALTINHRQSSGALLGVGIALLALGSFACVAGMLAFASGSYRAIGFGVVGAAMLVGGIILLAVRPSRIRWEQAALASWHQAQAQAQAQQPSEQ